MYLMITLMLMFSVAAGNVPYDYISVLMFSVAAGNVPYDYISVLMFSVAAGNLPSTFKNPDLSEHSWLKQPIYTILGQIFQWFDF